MYLLECSKDRIGSVSRIRYTRRVTTSAGSTAAIYCIVVLMMEGLALIIHDLVTSHNAPSIYYSAMFNEAGQVNSHF